MSTTTSARAWAVARRDGQTLGFTDHDAVLNFAGIRFRPDKGLAAKAVVQGTGLSVDNTEAAGVLSDDAITEADILAGHWDGAEVRLWEVDWAAPTNHRLTFRGHLGEVSREGASFRAELRGLSEPLNLPRGRVFHPRCAARLGDGACKLDLMQPGYFADVEAESIEGGRIFRFAAMADFAHRWFEQGQMIVLSGKAEGLNGVIKNDRLFANGTREVELWGGLGIEPAPGDRLQLLAGCDKAAPTCKLKFDNYLNFRGFPHLPGEDWLMAPQAVKPAPTSDFSRAFRPALADGERYND